MKSSFGWSEGSSNLLSFIARHEGWSAVPYDCPGGYRTIGHGHLLRSGEKIATPLSRERGRALLRSDILIAARALQSLSPAAQLNQGQFAALVSFIFNLGSARYRASTLRRYVNHHRHQAVPAQFKRWIFAAGRPLPGLVIRRAQEAHLYQHGQFPRHD